MRISLGNGLYIESRNTDVPSKRNVKNKGGSLKRLHSRETGRSAGGTNNTSRAIYANFITSPETGEVFIDRVTPRETCVTVDSTKRKYTWDLGGNCSTGYIGGKGI